MKKWFALLVGLSLYCGSSLSVRAAAAPDPGDKFLDAYFLIQDGDAAESKSDWARADAKYKAALDIIRAVQSQSPDWNPHIIEFRIRYCTEHIEALKPRLPVAPAAPAPPERPPSVTSSTPPPPVEPPPDRVQQLTAELKQAEEKVNQLQQERDALKTRLESELQKISPSNREETEKALEQIRALEATRADLTVKLQEAQTQAAQAETLRTELQQSQDKLRQLETDRDQLTARLQESLSKAAPAQITPQIEELLKQNTELVAQVAELKERLATGAGAVPSAEQIQLRTELLQTRGDLERTKQQLEKANQDLAFTKLELEKAQTENVRLRQSQDEIMARLNESDRQLRATRSSSDKDSEIILQLRKENTLLRQIADAKGPAAIRPRDTDEDSGFNNELKGWSSRRRPTSTPVAAKPAAPRPEPATTSMKESGSNKLVATLNAPTPPAPVESATPPVTATTTSAPPPSAQTPANEVVSLPVPTPVEPAAPVQQVAPIPATPSAPVPAPVQAPAPSPVRPPAVDARGMLNEARAALALKDYEAAALKYQEVLDKDPKNVTALSSLGAIRYQQGRLDDAEGLLRKASAAAPTDSTARSLLGVILTRRGQLDEAFNELTRAVALDPRNAEAHNYLGITLSEKGWATAAEGEIRRAIELNPQYADAHFNLAVTYAKQRTPRWELARYHYQKALDLGAQPDLKFEALIKSSTAPQPSESGAASPNPPVPAAP